MKLLHSVVAIPDLEHHRERFGTLVEGLIIAVFPPGEDLACGAIDGVHVMAALVTNDTPLRIKCDQTLIKQMRSVRRHGNAGTSHVRCGPVPGIDRQGKRPGRVNIGGE